ncbi:hypothetical protein RRG08_029633 [Elysia crispata]|uniref:Uncharacterized protein n=1 Tax=Elysia crispata TaxID=231223 RepID=A0AAE0XQI2_9GAST|nr:hypothetical protein RRG08_029633 [Elysia crispata]
MYQSRLASAAQTLSKTASPVFRVHGFPSKGPKTSGPDRRPSLYTQRPNIPPTRAWALWLPVRSSSYSTSWPAPVGH